MILPKTKKGLLAFYNSMPREVQAFFADVPHLVSGGFSLDVSLAYIFFRLEKGQRLALFCGARKLHKTESSLTWKAIDSHELTRNGFRELFRTIFGYDLSEQASGDIKRAEAIRDDLMHGRDVSEAKKREAIALALDYARAMNNLVANTKKSGFKPYSSDLRGFVGRLASLDKATTRWILKGMGFKLD